VSSSTGSSSSGAVCCGAWLSERVVVRQMERLMHMLEQADQTEPVGQVGKARRRQMGEKGRRWGGG
jgi:hypothetical protein